ncbi:g334 [Coccomyxa viridis]|uniref:G334 protein n=1 Tax=Coccomyxa viridis TaxID=1274662 RepID=A0ABP1FFG7_9CHLO
MRERMESKEESYLLVGTSTGHLQLHGSDGQLLHRQRLHVKAVTGITVRCAGMQAGSEGASEDITVCSEDAVARVSSLELQSPTYLRKTVGVSVKWPSLGYNKWDTSRKTGRRQAAICAGVKPPGLYTSMTGSDAKHPLVLITVSRSPAVTAFTVSKHAAHGALQLIHRPGDFCCLWSIRAGQDCSGRPPGWVPR